jgi:S1-C subfamily serine protease
MSDHGDWWSPRAGVTSAPEPWFDDLSVHPDALSVHHDTLSVHHDTLEVIRRRDPLPRRLVPGLIAGAAALAVAIAGGTVAIDRHSGALAAGLPGFDPAASNASVTKNPPPKTPSTHQGTAVPAPAPVLTVPQVAGLVEPGVVVIDSQLGYQNAEAAGTGMVLSPTGEILTNNHVIDGATSITVTIADTQQRFVARVVGTDKTQDVAVLQLTGASGLATIPLGDSNSVTQGQSVVGIGNAGGTGSLSVVTGSVTDTNRSIQASDQSGSSSENLSGMLEVQAPIVAGDSGGPLADRSGKVVGMDTAASAAGTRGDRPTFGFAIPINRALAIAAKLNAGDGSQSTGRGYLGIQVQAVDPATNSGGAEVISTNASSPAAVAGLKPGDIITTLGGRLVTSADQLTQLLSTSKPGELVTIGWSDAFGESHSVEVTLASGPAD